ncbi:hypothetical protein M3Y99_00163100 [Aphelenchoides fujianensis]|nr:hypothetical protein M3Y99_00163100 [Aphelenchoides fujianensis]
MSQVFLVDTFTPVPFQGNPAAVFLNTNEVDDERKRKFAGEFNVPTAFPRPVDSDDFLTAKRFKLDVFSRTTQLPISEEFHAFATAHVLTSLKNPNEEFEFETPFGEVKARVGMHDSRPLVFPLVELVSLDSHKQELTDKLQTAPDPNGVGQKIAALLPSELVVAQLVYCPRLKTLLIALDQATTHEQFMALSLSREAAVGRRSRRGEQPDYVLRSFEPWNQIDEDPGSGSAQITAAPFWAAVYNRSNSLKGLRFHPKRAAEFRIEVGENTVEISGQSIQVFNGFIAEKCL